MAKKRLKCPKCDRTFSMPAHLARHENSMHEAGRRATLAQPRMAGKRGRPRGSGTVFRGNAPGGNASDLIGRMQDYHNDLVIRRESLDSEITAITSAIEAMGAAAPARRGPGRPPGKRGRPAGRVGRPPGSGSRSGSLREYVFKALGQRNAAMSPREIAGTVQKIGYKTKARDLTKAVSNLLPQLEEVKRVGFGKYQL